MTVTEFARIYHIPHTVVYNASFRIPFESRQNYEGDYPHNEIMNATITELKQRNAFHQDKLDKNNRYLKQRTEGSADDG